MSTVNLGKIKESVVKLLSEVKDKLGIVDSLTMETEPTEFGIRSQHLVSIMGRLENELQIPIPLNCYIFYDPKLKKKLTVSEACVKLKKIIDKK